MAHKTLIDGTAYEVKGGRTLIDGTGYSIKGGRTLIGGTGYSISFFNGEVWKVNQSTSLPGNESINFECNGQEYVGLYGYWEDDVATGEMIPHIYFKTASGATTEAAFGDSGGYVAYWIETYRIITFLSPPSGTLLTWLQSNAVRQQ